MNKTDLVVFGVGGFGREVMWLIETTPSIVEKYNILGFIDDSEDVYGKTFNDYNVVGNSDWLLSRDNEIAVTVAVGSSQTRKSIFEKLSVNPKIVFPNIISSDAIISPYVSLGKGSIICASSIITVNIDIGDFLILNLDCTIGHDAVVGDFVTVNPSVNISGNVIIGDCVNIGTGSNIIQGKSIGSGSIIGAGAVVTSDIPANCTAVGVPAKPIKFNN